METGRTSKYLKYAIGEIFLVVIGILIALQINNWNEARKLEKRESIYLSGLKADLEQSVKALNRVIKKTSRVSKEAEFKSIHSPLIVQGLQYLCQVKG